VLKAKDPLPFKRSGDINLSKQTDRRLDSVLVSSWIKIIGKLVDKNGFSGDPNKEISFNSDGSIKIQDKTTFDIRPLDNNFTGKNTFKKGLITEGDPNKAALSIAGVQSSKDTTVNTNFQITGSYGTVIFDTQTDLVGLLPTYTSNTNDWVIIIKKKGDASKKLTLKDSNNVTIFEIYQNFIISFKNVNGLWKKINLSISFD
jgi:hypothetical protein